MEEQFDLYRTEYDKESRWFTIHDYINQEVIIIRTEQLEILIKKYCEINGRKLL
jgi:penicillin V acylase-like amidase (Ntn superfamily)